VDILRLPRVIFVCSLVLLWLSIRLGGIMGRWHPVPEKERIDLGIITTASLTLLALVIAFSFSMAVNRYDQRKNYEAEEANAIGTEYVRADLLPAAEATRVRELLRRYMDQRVLFYTTRDTRQLDRIDRETEGLQREMWSIVKGVANEHPTPPVTLAVSGMNDVLNRQGYTLAAWLNRIPYGAWSLMLVLAVCCGLLVGYGAIRHERTAFMFLPLILSIAFFLIADVPPKQP